MTIALAALTAFVAAVIQRITGLGFVLVLLSPIVLLYGAVDGVTLAVLLALVASLTAVPLVWRQVDWKHTLWLIIPGVIAAPLGALLTRALPEPQLMILIASLAFFALVAGWIPALARSFRGKPGAVTAGALAGFMHVASGLSGPALAAHAVGDKWEQRSFSSSVQVIFVAFSAVSVGLRGFPELPMWDVGTAVIATAVGIVVGSLLVRYVPSPVARRAMLAIAWLGAIVLFVRGVVALLF